MRPLQVHGLGNHESERRIPDELQPFVVRHRMIVSIRTVRQGLLEKPDVPEAVPEAPRKLQNRAMA